MLYDGVRGANEENAILGLLRIKGCRPLLVGVFYRPPNDKGDAIDHLGESLTRLGEKINSHNVILTGDFNLPNISWNDHTVRNGSNTRVANKLITLVEELGLSQHVKVATRRHGTTENILDLVFTNNPTLSIRFLLRKGLLIMTL